MKYNFITRALKYWLTLLRPFEISRLAKTLLPITCFLLLGLYSTAQNAPTTAPSDTSSSLTLADCINYGLKHQPFVNQSYIQQAIVRANNAINLAGWLPQVSAGLSAAHYIQLPSSFVNGNPQKTGINNTAIPGVTVSQAIFTPGLLFAKRAAPLYIQQAQQETDSTKIEVVAAVSKTFYALLLTLEQVGVLKEDTVRLSQSVTDAYHQYVGGIVDETDYEEATITLNNSKAQLKQATENIVPQYASLKQVMGLPPEQQFNISFDTTQMTKDIDIDTTEQLQYEKRIEVKQLATDKSLQKQLTDYYHLAWLPTASAFYDYNYEFENNSLPSLFNGAYPYSYIGLSVSIPIFTGFARVQNERKSILQEKQLDWAGVTLKSQIYSEYTSALANYKGNYYNLNVLDNNVAMAKRVYFVVTLQYKQGIVPYLNVITAESDLITSEINYYNALFQLLSSKIDLEKSMGNIPVQP